MEKTSDAELLQLLESAVVDGRVNIDVRVLRALVLAKSAFEDAFTLVVTALGEVGPYSRRLPDDVAECCVRSLAAAYVRLGDATPAKSKETVQ